MAGRGTASRPAGRRARAALFEPMEPRLLLDSVIINEIHYDPDIKTDLAEFVELYNTTGTDIDISHWTLSEGIDYEFPETTVLPAGGYVVVAQDPPTILSKFGTAAFGPFAGKLENDGERIVLRDEAGVTVDEVDYGAGFPWPTVGEAPGYSIELINPALDNDLAGSWRPSVGGGFAAETLIPDGADWMYFKGITEPSAQQGEWREIGFDETGWNPGTLAIGYSSQSAEQGFIETNLTDMKNGYTTVYLRKEFTVANPAAVTALELHTQYDDGINVWINGTYVRGLNVPSPELPYDGKASSAIENREFVMNSLTYPDPSSYLEAGTNVMAVQLLNASLGSSSDAFFDALLRTAWAGDANATPGRQNSVYADNAAPHMRQVEHSPNQPTAGEDVAVTIKVTDPDGVAGVTLDYQTVEPGDYISIEDSRYNDPAYWTTSLPMVDDGTGGDETPGDNVYTVVIPASVQTNRRLVRYRITATDVLGASITAPYPDDPQPNFAYYACDGVPSWTGSDRPGVEPVVEYSSTLLESLPVYTLITDRQDRLNAMYVPYRPGEADQQNPTTSKGYGGLDYLWHGTLVYDGVVYDHIRYRARGGVWRYAMGKNMWKFDFNRNHWFQARDDYGEPYDVKWDKLNFSALIQQGNYGQRGEQGLFEWAGFKLHNLAGNAAPNCNFLHFRIVDDADEAGPDQYTTDFQGLYMTIEQPDGRLLEEHDLPDGNFYKMEGGTGTLNNQGPTQPTDKSDLNAFMNGYKDNPDAAWWEANLDLADYYSFRAIAMAIHDYDMHNAKNYFYYNNPETGLWSVHNWDIDLCWTTTYGGGGGQGPLYDDSPYVHLLDIPQLRIAYNSRMREIRDLLFNPEQTGILLDECAQFIYTPGQLSFVDADAAMWDYNPILTSSYVNLSKASHGRFYGNAVTPPGDFAGMVEREKQYVASRMNAMDPKIPYDDGLAPNTPTITYTGLGGYPGDQLTFQCGSYSDPQGSGTFGAMQWRIAEVTIPGTPEFDPAKPRKYEIQADWESGEITSFNPSAAVPKDVVKDGHRYRVRVRMRDTDGHYSHWSEPVEFVAGPAMGSPVPLRITEIMYNPAEPDATPGNPEQPYTNNEDFEYLELKNIGAQAMDLTGIQFTEGVHFTFGAATLQPGEYVLVVKNTAAFNARYDPTGAIGYSVAGEFDDDTNLGNAGDDLILKDPLGFTVHDFQYSDGWFPHTDGEGFSLIVRNATQDVDLWDAKDGWRASWAPDGNPGQADPSPLNPADVVINEALAHSNGADGDWIELANTTGSAIHITGWYLSDDPDNLLKYKIGAAAPVSIDGGGFVVFTEAANFGGAAGDPGRFVPFALSEFGDVVGDALYLTSSPDGIHAGGYREDEFFGPSLGDVSFGRYEKPSGGKDFVPMVSRTMGGPNSAPVIPDVVINEIMYHPETGGLEFIELANRTGTDVPLHDSESPANPWKFTDGVTYTFPAGAYVPAGGYALVIGVDRPTFESVYGPVPGGVNVYGPWDGALADEGERLRLSFPGEPEWTAPPPGESPGYVPYIVAEKITYNDKAPWPTTPDGDGPSLERIDPDAYGNDVANWAASPLAGGTPGWANGAAPPNVTVDIEATDPNAAEQARNPGTFTVTRTGGTANPLIVYYSTSGTAVGADYEPALPGWVEIPAGLASAAIEITPLDDTDAEPNETLVMTLAADQAYLVGAAGATVTIEDNDGSTPDVAVHMVATDPDAAEQDADTGRFTIYRVGDTPGPLTVYYTVGGTAGQADYAETLSGQIVIQPTDDDVSFGVTPVDDTDLEPNETILLTITPDASYLVGTSAAAVTIVDNDDLPPVVTGVVLNPDDDRTVRGVSGIDPSALGVETVRVTFSEEVVFAPGDVTADKVEFDDAGNQIDTVTILPENITVSATAPKEMTITFADSWQQTVDTWVRITLADTIADLDSHPLDGEPKGNSSGLGYIYDDGLDLPSGNGAAGGDAVFYVGSLRGDLRGFGPEPENDPPNGSIDSWDIGGFTQKFQERDLDADFRGFGPEPENDPPNGDVDSWDIGGFTSRYMTALATGAHLGNLPTDGGGGMAAGAPSPLPLTDAPEVDLLLASAAATPDGVARPRDTQRDVSRVAWPRLRGHVLPLRRAGNTVTEQQAAVPASPSWSPLEMSLQASADTPAAAVSDLDGGMVDLLAVPALAVSL